ncbi:hypothetical protein AB0O22_02195 [Streptomyces sp. NPDC091204]
MISTAETVLAATLREREAGRPGAGASAGASEGGSAGGSDGRLIALPGDD